MMLVPMPALAATSGHVWPAGSRGAVSLTYDDGLDSQLDLAVPALERHGFRGTFFLTLDNIRHRLADWEALAPRGHELANHTVTHPCDLARFTPDTYRRRELMPVARWLARVEPRLAVRSFAYPCDVTDLGPGNANQQEMRFDRLLARTGIAVARTSEGEPNRPATALRRPHRLQALAVGYDATDFSGVDAYLGRAAQQGYWAILVFHAIADLPTQEGETGTRLHEALLDAIGRHQLWCAPMAKVFDRIRRHV